MSPEQQPSYDIGHFQIENIRSVINTVKYVVSLSRETMAYVLHADESVFMHADVARKAGLDFTTVIGGGNIGWASEGVRLQGYSQRFGQEPDDVRGVLDGMVNQRLKDRIEEFKEQAAAAKKS